MMMPMRNTIPAVLLTLLACSAVLPAQERELRTLNDSLSYVGGVMVIRYAKELRGGDSLPVVRRSLAEGIAQARGAAPALSDSAIDARMRGLDWTQPEAASRQLGTAVGAALDRLAKLTGLAFEPDLVAEGIADRARGIHRLAPNVARTLEIRLQHATVSMADARRRWAADSLRALGEANELRAAAFLADNRKRSLVKVLPNGVQYEILKPGTGKRRPKTGQSVVLRYRVSLVDGREAAANLEEENPAAVPMASLLQGVREALEQMNVGSRWRLYIPPEYAYGLHASPDGRIPPGSLLVYDAELVGIAKAR